MELHQILKRLDLFQKQETKNMKEKFVQQYKIYIGKTLVNEHPKKLQ